MVEIIIFMIIIIYRNHRLLVDLAELSAKEGEFDP